MKALTYIKANGFAFAIIFLVLGWLTITRLLPRLELQRLVDSQAPDVQLFDLDGKAVKTSSLQGRPTLYVFWATWCGACRNEIPDLIELRERVPAGGLNIVALTDSNQQAKEVLAFRDKMQINYQVAMSTTDLDRKFGVKAYPTHIWVDAKGIIEDVSLGQDSRIKNYLSE